MKFPSHFPLPGAIGHSSALRLAMRLTAVFSLAILVAGAVSFVVLTEELQGKLGDQAKHLATGLEKTLQEEGPQVLRARIANYVDGVDDHYSLYLFAGPGGKVLAGNITAPPDFTGARILQAGRDMRLIDGEPDQEGHRFAAYGLRVGPWWIVAGRDTVWIRDSRDALVQAIAWGLGAALALSAVLAALLAWRSERRIRRINAVLDAVAGGDLGQRASDPGEDDIGRIAGSLNAMLDRLELSIEGLRQVSNDVAHDLRTPLTRLRNRLEPLLARSDLPEGAEAEVTHAVAETETLVKTFNAILRIAQLEGGSAAPPMRPLDLAALAMDVFEMLEPVADGAGHTLRIDAPAPAMVQGDRDILAQALTNIVENAIRHCPAPARIVLAVSAGAGRVSLSVCDDGPGIKAADRERALRRFVRLDLARAGAGSGLGLSLVAAVMRLHEAALTLGANPGSSSGRPGLCVSASFPAGSSS